MQQHLKQLKAKALDKNSRIFSYSCIKNVRNFLKNQSDISFIDRLKKQRDAIQARIESAEARVKSTQRKQDTRRKILIGAYFWDKAVKENTLPQIKALMKDYLTRNADRKLFELEVLQKNDQN